MIKILKEVKKEELIDFIYNIDIEDPKLYEELNDPNSIGIFQLKGKTAAKFCEEVQPNNFEDANAVNALARPGPIEVAAPYFVARKRGEPSPYPDVVNEILNKTYGTIVYQEQVMSIFHKVGGFTLEGANNVRGLMKKLGKADKSQETLKEWSKVVKKFKNGCIKNGITEKEADSLANDILSFSNYSFNRCFSGDSRIDRDNKAIWNPTIEEMYVCKNDKKWAKKNGHYSLYKKYIREGYGYAYSQKGERLFLNKIKDIYFQGKRTVYLIRLENGKQIKVTSNHSFPVLISEENQEILQGFGIRYKSLDTGLIVGDKLLFNAGYEKENLIICCSSCHKKEDYKLDRRKKNEKGLKIGFSKIIEIKKFGKVATYDVEMEAPFHTVCVNGILAKNSHAISYTYIAIMTLYFSVYFRKYFYSSILNYEIDRDKYLLDVIRSIKNHGFEILPPEINLSEENIIPGENKNILFGLTNIKYVGDKAVEIILSNKPYNSFIDFVLKTRNRSVTSRVITSLISVGTFDKMNPNRKKLLLMFERFWKEKKTTKIKEKLISLWKKINEETDRIPGINTNISDLRNYEKNFFGMCIFTSLFTKNKIDALYKMKKQNLIHLNFEDITLYSKKTPVCLNSIRTFNDKNQNEMAFVDLEDIFGNILSIPVFSSYWKFIKNYFILNNLYLMNLYRDDDGKILFGQRAWTTSEFKILRMIKKI